MLSNRVVLATLLGAALVITACGAEVTSPLDPTVKLPAYSVWSGPQGGQHGWGDNKPASCHPLSPRTVGKDIGPLGGTLQIGPHRLTILPGALVRTIHITATVSGDSANSIQFAPEGLHFLVPALLDMSYANCKQLPGAVKVVYTSNDLVVLLELIASRDNKLDKSVIGIIEHFSRYAVAY